MAQQPYTSYVPEEYAQAAPPPSGDGEETARGGGPPPEMAPEMPSSGAPAGTVMAMAVTPGWNMKGLLVIGAIVGGVWLLAQRKEKRTRKRVR